MPRTFDPTRHRILGFGWPGSDVFAGSAVSVARALDKYTGTLVFVSHDREFVSSLATRIIELKPGGVVVDFKGSYEDYLESEKQALAVA